MNTSFDLREIESLENFMSLKRGISNTEVQEFERLLYPNGVSRSVTSNEIDALERSLGVIAPAEYRRFLIEYGYASWFGGAVYGITPGACTDPSLDLSVSKLARQVRGINDPSLAPLVNHSWIIDKDDAGGYIVMASADDDVNGRVDLLVHENHWLVAASWPSLFARLAEQLK